MSQNITKKSLVSLIVPVVLGCLVMLTYFTGLWEKAELSFYDTWFVVRGQEDPGQDIVIVTMDEKSISRLGNPSNWSREIHARFLDNLREAKVVGFDLLFDTPKDSSGDQLFADSLARNNNAVLAVVTSMQQDEKGNWFQQIKLPIEELSMNTSGLGFINMPMEKGNMVRRVTAVDLNSMDTLGPIPSFSLALDMIANDLDFNDMVFNKKMIVKKDYLQAGKIRIPLEKDNQAMIDFWGPAHTFPTYSYVDVLEGRIKPAFFKGKSVLVGLYSPLIKEDYYENPFTRGSLVLKGDLPLPGVEIHASALKTYRTNRFFHRAPQWVNLLFLLILWAGAFLASRHSKPWYGFIYTVGIVACTFGVVYFSWLYAHYWIDFASPLAIIGLTYIGGTIESFVQAEMERRRTRAMFSRYVSQAVVDELMLNNAEIELGGTSKEVTVLFSDIRGFTAFSEGKPPEVIVARLNEYFTVMTNLVFKHGGTLDKYLGDGMMAVFGAPIHYPDHASRAIMCAMEMLEKIEDLNQEWTRRGEVTMGIGIGINSGPVIVGNIGSLERMEYTVIGEDVNLASRLESMNKEHHTQIIFSERTQRLLNERNFPYNGRIKSLGGAKVRGLTEDVEIFTIS
ncbi:MAG: CHASE2 domain-containing protein [Candidatus Saccharibacteria bacterium]